MKKYFKYRRIEFIMNVLAIGCHPDDLEIGCYGTLAKYIKQGHDVAVCHVANGNLGHVEIMPDELRKIRFQEAENAAKVIGATHYAVDANDLYVTAEDDALITRLAAVVRDVQPDLIITHYDHDYMNDHMQTYYAALRASDLAAVSRRVSRALSGVQNPVAMGLSGLANACAAAMRTLASSADDAALAQARAELAQQYAAYAEYVGDEARGREPFL